MEGPQRAEIQHLRGEGTRALVLVFQRRNAARLVLEMWENCKPESTAALEITCYSHGEAPFLWQTEE